MKYNYYSKGKVCPICKKPICNRANFCSKHFTRPSGKESPNWKGGKSSKHPCPDCGKPIWYSSKYCLLCAIPHKPSQFKEKNKNWKGGRIQDKDGYILIKNKNHHRAKSNGYVLEHILIWEQTHNKLLPDGWVIHHLNGIRNDNRTGNLAAMPNRKHYLLNQAQAKRIQELEASLNHQNQLL